MTQEMGAAMFVGACLIVAVLSRRGWTPQQLEQTEKSYRLRVGVLLLLFVWSLLNLAVS